MKFRSFHRKSLFIVCMVVLASFYMSGFAAESNQSFNSDYYDQTIDEADLVALLLTWQQDPTTTMTIDWHILVNESGEMPFIWYRSEGTPHWHLAEGETLDRELYPGRWRYRVELTHLTPNTTYEFTVGGVDRVFRFQTMPSNLEQPIRFAIGGDTRHRQDWMEEMNRVVMRRDPQFVVWGGDLAYANGEERYLNRWGEWYEAIFNTFIREDGLVIPVITGLGNHEVIGNGMSAHENYEETDEWRARIAPYFMGFLAFPGQPGYGVLDFGDYLSLVLPDTNHLNSITGVQLDWLKQTLAERDHVHHVIPVYHVPAYSSVRKPSTSIQQNWVPLFEEAGVRVAFENHDHAYKRTIPILNGAYHPRGIVYLGDGSWGVTPRDVHPPGSTWYLARAEKIRAGMVVTLSVTDIHVETWSHAGDLIDEYTIVDGLYIESPLPDAEVGADERIIISKDARVQIDHVIVEQNDEEIYRGTDLPIDLKLHPDIESEKEDLHTLRVTLVDNEGNIRQQTSEFHVRPVYMRSPLDSERVHGDVEVAAVLGLPKGEQGIDYAINAWLIESGERVKGENLEKGTDWPGTTVLNTLELEDGTYDIELVVNTNADSTYADVRRIIVRNWNMLSDPMDAPQTVAFFGSVFDRSKTSDRSDGWKYVTNDDVRLSADDSLMVPTTSNVEYLEWEHDHIRKFEFVVYVQDKENVQNIRVEVLDDNANWNQLFYVVDEQDEWESGWRELIIRGDVPNEIDPSRIRFVWDGTVSDNGINIQLGHATIVGRVY